MNADIRRVVISGQASTQGLLGETSARGTVTPPPHAQEQLQFAIDFVERDLSRLPGTAWPSLSREMTTQFFRGQAAGHGPLPERYPKKALLELQREVRQVFDRILSGAERKTPTSSARFTVTVSYEIQQMGGGGFALDTTGSIRDRFMMVLAHALRDVGPNGIRRCVCGRYFARLRRQKYCNDAACAKRRTKAYWAAYINSDQGVAARKKQYAKGGWTFGGRQKASARKRAK